MGTAAKRAARSRTSPLRRRGPTGATVIEPFLAAHPAAGAVFRARHMQCPGCSMARFDTLAEASQVYGISLPVLLAELTTALANERLPQPSTQPQEPSP